jgi:hypothetical protein
MPSVMTKEVAGISNATSGVSEGLGVWMGGRQEGGRGIKIGNISFLFFGPAYILCMEEFERFLEVAPFCALHGYPVLRILCRKEIIYCNVLHCVLCYPLRYHAKMYQSTARTKIWEQYRFSFQVRNELLSAPRFSARGTPDRAISGIRQRVGMGRGVYVY